MQTRLPAALLATERGQQADAILRSCVHCGFCTATCPTYLATGDERDGPRGRIYLIKAMLEDEPVSAHTQRHLDRCLTCRACETTCPSGVEYSQLLDIGRDEVERRVGRRGWPGLQRRLLRWWLPYPRRLRPLLRVAHGLAPLLPTPLRAKLPPLPKPLPAVTITAPTTTMLLLEGCVQSVATPATNHALRRVLARQGVALVVAQGSGCCGALSHHLDGGEQARDFMRRNIDAWWPHIEQGVGAILVSASGCGAELKRYGELLRLDSRYAERAARIAALVKDPCEVIDIEQVKRSAVPPSVKRVALHTPCTLQHGLHLGGRIEPLLSAAGYQLTPVRDGHLCCGSAGTYSLLQPAMAAQLQADKLAALQAALPDCIATANVGCQLHLAAASSVPVVHWLQLLAGDAVVAMPLANVTPPTLSP